MHVSPLSLLLVLGTAVLVGCTVPAAKQPPVRGNVSRRDVADVVADIGRTSSDRILLIEESLGEVTAYTGDKSGGLLYLFRRRNGRLQGCGGGYWRGEPQEGAGPFDPNWRYDPSIRYDVGR